MYESSYHSSIVQFNNHAARITRPSVDPDADIWVPAFAAVVVAALEELSEAVTATLGVTTTMLVTVFMLLVVGTVGVPEAVRISVIEALLAAVIVLLVKDGTATSVVFEADVEVEAAAVRVEAIDVEFAVGYIGLAVLNVETAAIEDSEALEDLVAVPEEEAIVSLWANTGAMRALRPRRMIEQRILNGEKVRIVIVGLRRLRD